MKVSSLPSAIRWGICPPDETPALGVDVKILPGLVVLLPDNRRAQAIMTILYSPSIRDAYLDGWRFGKPVYHPESCWFFLPLRHACGEPWRLKRR